MRTGQFQVTSVDGLAPQYFDIDTTGTALDGIAAGAPVALTLIDDLPTTGRLSGGGGDGVVTARVAATNSVRVRVAQVPADTIVGFLITELT